MIKIGYQGIEGSNAEKAAKDLVKKLNLADVEYVPLVDSPHVIKAMKTGETDYGVCAVYNSVAGSRDIFCYQRRGTFYSGGNHDEYPSLSFQEACGYSRR